MSRVLIGYDIHDNRRRRHALKLLRTLTACYQKSFFDCTLPQQRTNEVWERLTDLLNPEEDGLVLAWLDPGMQHAIGQRWAFGGQSLFLVL